MKTKLPKIIGAYVKASNQRDHEAFAALFSDDAVVHDEGQGYRGIVAIKNWLTATAEKYQFTLTPTHVTRDGEETTLTATLTGDFPGSPVSTQFRFTLHDGKIATLDIGG